MNRRRSRGKSAFPPNLYEHAGYYSYRNPITGDVFGIGSNRQHAFNEAIQANIKIAQQLGRPSLVDRMTGDRKRSVAAWEEKYQGRVAKMSLTKATKANYLTLSRHVVKQFGDRSLKALRTVDVSEWLDAMVEERAGVAKAVKAYMRLSFEQAVSEGWIDANPIRPTKNPIKTTVKRSRLSLEVFMRVYKDAGTWLQNAMALALVSAQRREDVANAEFKDFREGGWWLTQASEKTDHPHRIFIPDNIQPKGFGLSLSGVLARCRKTGVLSPYLCHQTRRQGRSKVGDRIGLATITKAFTDAIEALGLDWGDKTPPTFHEIRSLSQRLYAAQGVNTQHLLGHSDADTTALYNNSRGLDWVRITI